ncbi:MAG: GntR family transcriptional regulator [Acidimicrobiales bacterium]|nr:GntR family transcriptional regulator [Acidimicrobiales bacterium]
MVGYVPKIVPWISPRGRDRRLVLRLDGTSTIPPFEQLRAQLAVMVATGLLEPGSRLPPIRSMAEHCDLAPGTVARAYRELELDGVAEGRGRSGTFVVDEPPESAQLDERRRQVDLAAGEFAFRMRQLGVSPPTAIDAIQAALAQPEDGPIG